MDLLGNLGHLLLAYPWAAALVAAAAIGGVVYYFYKTTIDFWLMDAWYCTPLVGRTAQLARRVSPAADQAYKGWLQSEVTLGSDYASHVHSMSPKAFREYRTYLGRAGDGGRRPLPGWMMAVLVVLVAAEAYGISYLIAGGLARNMSENARVIGTGAIVIVVCIGLVWLTHAAGKNLYRNLLVDGNVNKWDEAMNAGDGSDLAAQRERLPLETHAGITIEDGHLDDDHPDYSQCLNRVGNKTTWFVFWIALALILIFGGFQVALRVNDSLQKLTRDTIGISAGDSAQTSSPIPNFGDPQAPALPAVIADPDKRADGRANDEEKSTEVMGGWLTSLALAFIYLMTQVTSIYAGYSFGFAGEYSEEAYRETHGCQVYETYLKEERRLKGIAERRMQTLHQRMRDKARNRNITFGGDFYRFLLIHEPRTVTHRDHASPQPAAARPAKPQGIQDHLARMESMSTDEMKTYLMGLPEDQFNQVRPHVPAMLAARATRAKRGDDLEILFPSEPSPVDPRGRAVDQMLAADGGGGLGTVPVGP